MNDFNLEQIGLTESEVKVYLAMLRLGETTAGPIVEEAKVTRSKIYDILERLKNKGLVSHITKKSTKYFNAADPSNILTYLKDKEKEIEKKVDFVEEILPRLKSYYENTLEKRMAEIFVGMSGMKNAFSILINEFSSDYSYYAFGAGKGEKTDKIQLFFENLNAERTKHKVKSFIIFNESSRGIFKSQEKSRLVKPRYLMHTTPVAINIYKNYTIIAILTAEPITFLLRNKEVADSFKEYFNVMWEIAKE